MYSLNFIFNFLRKISMFLSIALEHFDSKVLQEQKNVERENLLIFWWGSEISKEYDFSIFFPAIQFLCLKLAK